MSDSGATGCSNAKAARRAGMCKAGLLLGALLIALGCTSTTRDRWLRVFFDGVPPRGPNGSAAEPAPPKQKPAATARRASQAEPWFVHVPYRDRDCKACHESASSQKQKGKTRDVCFACHDDFLKAAQHKHEPASDGDCLRCHLPHKSREPHLLQASGKALCYTCHTDEVTPAKHRHAPADKGQCTKCHDAHRSAEEGLLRKPADKLCFDCHGALLASRAALAPAPPGAADTLLAAVRANDREALRAGLKANPAVVAATNRQGVTALHVAAALNRKDLADALLAAGADANARTANGFTPLHWAAGRNATEAVALLLAAGADGEARSSDGATALQYAQQKKATGSMALLAGAQRHAKAPQAAPAPAGSRAAPAEAKFKHCPVAQGQCAECHDSHKSSREHLLKKAGQALCLNCHDRKDVSAIKAHAAIGDGDCTMCHDPHRSDNKALLRTAKP